MESRFIVQKQYDAYLNWGQDLSLSANGDLLITTDVILSEQLVIRRLMTNPTTYIWFPTYGAGIPAFVGQALTDTLYDEIKSVIQANIYEEASVAQLPSPEIFIQTIQSGIFCQINYTVSPLQQPVVINFNTEQL